MKYLLSLVFVTIHLSIVFAQVKPNFESQIDSLFQEYSGEKPGVSVAVVKDGEIVFKKGYGTANLEYNVPVKTSTVFHIASVSKQFTAFSAYLLEAEGKISLEDDVRKYIPELPDYGKTIKIRHLLSHTSGLKDQWALLSLSGWRMDDVITNSQILKLVSHQKELNFEPGSQFSYSNTGYTLMAILTERVTNKTFSEFTQDHIFQPLGMVNTQFYDNHEKVIANRAYSYEKYEDTYIKKKLNYSTVGATSLFTTVEDLAKWVSNFHNPIVGTPQLINKFNEVSYLNNDTPVIWGQTPDRTMYHAKGQMSYLYKGIPVLSHGGHDAGYRAVLTRYPEHQFAVITLSNNEHYTMIQKTFPLAELYLKDFLVEKPNKETPPSQEDSPAKKKYVNQLNTYEGVYASEALGAEYKIQLKDGQLIMVHKRLDDIVLNEMGKDKFWGVNSFPFEMKFIWKNSQIAGYTISNFGAKNLEFIKKGVNEEIKKVIVQDSLSPETLQPITHYFSIEAGQLVGEGADFLKKEIAKAQFTLLGDYPDSKNSSDFTTALLPKLQDAKYKTMALGIGVPSARMLNSIIKEPTTVISKLKTLNNKHAFLENKNLILPMPDMKSVSDARFVQKAGELQWNIIGFGNESWNNLPWLLEQIYGNLSQDVQREQLALYEDSKTTLEKLYANRSGDLLSFAKAVKNSKSIQDFLKIADKKSAKNHDLVEAFHNSIKNCHMHAQKQFFKKNKWRVDEEKRLLRRELERIDFNIHQDKLFVKWDMNFLSRGFQPYAFYGVGNTLSEIAEYNGNKSLHIGIVPRFKLKNELTEDLLQQENSVANRLAKLVQIAKKDHWTVIDLQQMIQETQYTPVKYLLDEQVQDLIKRYDLIVIPALEKEATLNYRK